jgi:hypothetical protein
MLIERVKSLVPSAMGSSCRRQAFAGLGMISAQTRSAFVARENHFTLFRIML